MAWLADLAGKAEEFLNRVDQTAAVALQKEELLKTVKRSSTVINSLNPPPSTVIQSQGLTNSQQKLQTSSSSPSRSPTQLSKGVLPLPSANVKSSNEDDKLFEFLNSPDTDVLKTNLSTINQPQLNQDNEIEVLTTNNITRTEETPQFDSSFAVQNQLNHSTQENNASLKSSVEMENKLLQNEVTSLNQELSQMFQRTKKCEAELSETKLKLLNVTESGRLIQELQNREADVQEALTAKDSQLAVLRVRLQEADQELRIKRETLDRLENDRDRILQDQSNSSGLHSQALQTLRDKLEEAENTIFRDRNNFKALQNELNQRIAKLEEENKVMGTSLVETQQQYLSEKEHSSEFASQVRQTKDVLDSSRQELIDYKQKAQKILQSKEKLIATLKVANTSGAGGQQCDMIAIAAGVELEEVKQEKDMIRDELLQANGNIERLRNEIQDLEVQLQTDLAIAREQQQNLEEQLNGETKMKEEILQDYTQLKEEMQFMKEELCRQKTMFQSRINDRDNEIEKLRTQLTVKTMNNNQAELESRLRALTESLIQKQTMLEALSTEKSSLILQLERMELQMKENQSYIRRGNSTTLSVTDDNQAKGRMPEFLLESPFDGQMTRRVKRVYNNVDKVSVRLGIFLRRYPMARIVVVVYMCLLHLFVMLVLFTYTPEIHSTTP